MSPHRPALKSIALGLILGPAVAPAADPADRGFAFPTWTQVRFEASNALAKAVTEISLEPAPDAQLLQAPKGQPIDPDAGSVMLATAEIKAKIPFQRKHWRGQVWFDRATGAGLQRVRTKFGGDANSKSYRFGREGTYRLVVKGRQSADAAASGNVKKAYFSYPTSRPGCELVSAPLLLLIEASTLSGQGGTHKRVCVFNKKTLYHVDLTADSAKALEIDYDLTTADGRSSKTGAVTATRVRLAAQRVDPDAPHHEDFQFLGLEGDIAVVVEDATGIPLSIEGDLSGNRVRFQLRAARVVPL